jgi:ABC-type sugar transport system ATPase subunit
MQRCGWSRPSFRHDAGVQPDPDRRNRLSPLRVRWPPSDFLVLDEPTASLPADEVERLFAALRPAEGAGVGMIYVSHRLDEIFRIADRVAVLRDGQMVGMRPIEHTPRPRNWSA